MQLLVWFGCRHLWRQECELFYSLAVVQSLRWSLVGKMGTETNYYSKGPPSKVSGDPSTL